MLQREFALDDEALDELAEELVEVQRLAARGVRSRWPCRGSEGRIARCEQVGDPLRQARLAQALVGVGQAEVGEHVAAARRDRFVASGRSAARG
jgi:hypothetical protein